MVYATARVYGLEESLSYMLAFGGMLVILKIEFAICNRMEVGPYAEVMTAGMSFLVAVVAGSLVYAELRVRGLGESLAMLLGSGVMVLAMVPSLRKWLRENPKVPSEPRHE